MSRAGDDFLTNDCGSGAAARRRGRDDGCSRLDARARCGRRARVGDERGRRRSDRRPAGRCAPVARRRQRDRRDPAVRRCAKGRRIGEGSVARSGRRQWTGRRRCSPPAASTTRAPSSSALPIWPRRPAASPSKRARKSRAAICTHSTVRPRRRAMRSTRPSRSRGAPTTPRRSRRHSSMLPGGRSRRSGATKPRRCSTKRVPSPPACPIRTTRRRSSSAQGSSRRPSARRPGSHRRK